MRAFFTFFTRKHTVFQALLAIVLFTSVACEKVLDIDLKDSEPRIVIEANFSDLPGPHQVLISRSVSFNDPNVFPQISGAQIILSDNVGNAETLTETQPGVYEIQTLQGIPGRTYTMKVLVDGIEYVAISTMPLPVAIAEITVGPFPFDPESDAVTIRFPDPVGRKNYYRAYYLVNDTLSDNISFFSDEFNEGKLVEELFIDEQDLDLNSGDTATVRLQAIDENVFRFLREQQQLGNPQSSSPANPKSNFTNGAFGYFSAHAETSAKVRVP